MEYDVVCPKCEWKPDGNAHWECSCGIIWNTFDTGGKCPGCGKGWKDTQCPGPGDPGGCGGWSPHIDWYRGLDRKVREEIEKALKNHEEISPKRQLEEIKIPK